MKKMLAVFGMAIITLAAVAPQAGAVGLLDKGKVSFTFDDWAASQHRNAFPILKERGIPATAYVIGGYVGWGDYYGSWEQLLDVQAAGWEVGNHSHTHPHFSVLTPLQIKRQVARAERAFLSHGIKTSGAFALPYGEGIGDPVITNALKATGLLSSSRQAWEESEALNSPSSFNRWAINVVDVKRFTTFGEVKAHIDRAKSEKKWLVMVYHDVLPEPTDDYGVRLDIFCQMAEYVHSSVQAGELDAITVSEGTKLMQINKFLP